MPGSTALNPQAEADRIEAAADQAIAACGGNARDAVKALIITNEFLENEVSELMRAVSTPTCGDVQDLDGDKKWIYPVHHQSRECRSRSIGYIRSSAHVE